MNLCIIQARTTSTRLPNKVLLPLEDKTVLEHIYYRVKQSKFIDNIVIAIPENDDKLREFCYNNNLLFWCGDENNVLDRFYQCWKQYNEFYKKENNINYDNIVRITADEPLISWEIIDKVIEKHIKEDNDYTITGLPGVGTFPDGCDCGIMKYQALEKAWKEAKLESEIQHVTPYIANHPELFKIGILENDVNYNNKRWTLDQKEDYEFIKLIYSKLYKKDKYFGYQEILDLLEEHPEYEKINNNIGRDEGYFKDLEKERIKKYGI